VCVCALWNFGIFIFLQSQYLLHTSVPEKVEYLLQFLCNVEWTDLAKGRGEVFPLHNYTSYHEDDCINWRYSVICWVLYLQYPMDRRLGGFAVGGGWNSASVRWKSSHIPWSSNPQSDHFTDQSVPAPWWLKCGYHNDRISLTAWYMPKENDVL